MVKKFLGEKFMSIGKSLLPKNAREILKDKGVKTITDLEKFSIDDAIFLIEEKLKDKKGSISKKTKISNKKTTKKKKS